MIITVIVLPHTCLITVCNNNSSYVERFTLISKKTTGIQKQILFTQLQIFCSIDVTIMESIISLHT